MSTDVSIIIPNLNSPVSPRVLEAVRSQTTELSRTEVLVVGRDDLGLVDEDRLVRFIESDRPIPPAQARNRGRPPGLADVHDSVGEAADGGRLPQRLDGGTVGGPVEEPQDAQYGYFGRVIRKRQPRPQPGKEPALRTHMLPAEPCDIGLHEPSGVATLLV